MPGLISYLRRNAVAGPQHSRRVSRPPFTWRLADWRGFQDAGLLIFYCSIICVYAPEPLNRPFERQARSPPSVQMHHAA